MIAQNGLSLDDEKVGDSDRVVTAAELERGAVVRIGKKKFFKLIKGE